MVSSEVWYGVITGRDSPEDLPLRASDHPFLRGLSRPWVEGVSQGSVDTNYEPGEILFREGEVADRFYLVFHGRVALEVTGPGGCRCVVQTVGPGEVLDWSCLGVPYLWRFDGRAVKETRVVSLSSSVLRRALDARPADGFRFLQRLLLVTGQRLESARSQLVEGREL